MMSSLGHIVYRNLLLDPLEVVVQVAGAERVQRRKLPGCDLVTLTSGGNIISLGWDKDGEVLSVLQSGNLAIIVWDAAQRKTLAHFPTSDRSQNAWCETARTTSGRESWPQAAKQIGTPRQAEQ